MRLFVFKPNLGNRVNRNFSNTAIWIKKYIPKN